MTKTMPERAVERAERDQAVAGVEAADTGGVDQAQPGTQHQVRDRDLDHPQPAAVARVARLGDERSHLVDRNGDGRRVGLGLGRLDVRGHARALAVAHDGRDRGDDVGVDRADRGLQQGVDQRALAALELADDRDRDDLFGDLAAGLVEMGGQILAAAGQRERAALGDAVERAADRHRPAGTRPVAGAGGAGAGSGSIGVRFRSARVPVRWRLGRFGRSAGAARPARVRRAVARAPSWRASSPSPASSHSRK